MKKSLLALAIGGFGIGMTEFVIMGLLQDVAADLSISIPTTGRLITAYALGVVVGAPILAGTTGKFSPRNVLIAMMGIFTLFNGLSALAPNYNLLLLSRFCAGLPHGAFFGVGAVVAARLAGPGKTAAAVAVMVSGLTIANVIGVPIGTYVGHNYSWRLTFGIVALIGVLTMIAVYRWVPLVAGNKDSSLKHDLKIFKNFNLWLVIGVTSIGFSGFFAWYSYISPVLTEVSKFSPQHIPFVITLVGVGMTVGNILGGRLADRYSPIKAIIALLLAMISVLALNVTLAESQIAIVILTFVTGAVAMAVCAPIQVLLIKNAREAEVLGSSLGQMSFNIANALGAFAGGIPLAMGLAYTSPQWVGAGLAGIGVVIASALFLRER